MISEQQHSQLYDLAFPKKGRINGDLLIVSEPEMYEIFNQVERLGKRGIHFSLEIQMAGQSGQHQRLIDNYHRGPFNVTMKPDYARLDGVYDSVHEIEKKIHYLDLMDKSGGYFSFLSKDRIIVRCKKCKTYGRSLMAIPTVGDEDKYSLNFSTGMCQNGCHTSFGNLSIWNLDVNPSDKTIWTGCGNSRWSEIHHVGDFTEIRQANE